MTVLSEGEVTEALERDLPEWKAGDGGKALVREVRAASFLEGIALVQEVAEAAEAADHHPDIDIRYTTLTFTLSTHSAGGVTGKDLELASAIDRLAAESESR
jgi:4a-hydroxytetrahydrobiopterin dehydratase